MSDRNLTDADIEALAAKLLEKQGSPSPTVEATLTGTGTVTVPEVSAREAAGLEPPPAVDPTPISETPSETPSPPVTESSPSSSSSEESSAPSPSPTVDESAIHELLAGLNLLATTNVIENVKGWLSTHGIKL